MHRRLYTNNKISDLGGFEMSWCTLVFFVRPILLRGGKKDSDWITIDSRQLILTAFTSNTLTGYNTCRFWSEREGEKNSSGFYFTLETHCEPICWCNKEKSGLNWSLLGLRGGFLFTEKWAGFLQRRWIHPPSCIYSKCGASAFKFSSIRHFLHALIPSCMSIWQNQFK